jgi:N,N'-diacetyllegionaminate synthase
MSNIDEIKSSIKILNKNFKKDITLLHCVSSYPAKKKDLNLNLINSLKKEFRLTVGYSDHSIGEEACLAAVAMGSTIIEKHVTLSKNMIGPDHKSSSNIKEFINLVKNIRKLETMMGINEKKILKNELNVQSVARKSIVSKTFLKKGKFLKRSDITFKRPGTGIDPMNFKKIIGKKLRKNILVNRLILSKDII